MDNKKLIFIIVAIVILGAVGYFIVSGNQSGNLATQSSSVENQNPELAKRYIQYSPENLANATKNDGKAVIFFHASWCSTCIAAERDFKANFGKVPKNVTILQTDYDTSTELKQKYSVTYQDAFVQVDSQGNEIIKWSSGGQGVLALLANLK